MTAKENPYAPPAESATLPSVAETSFKPKQRFRWQILAALYCVVALVPSCISLFVSMCVVLELPSRWNENRCSVAHILYFSTGLLIAASATILLGVAARTWMSDRPLMASLFTVLGTSLMIAIYLEVLSNKLPVLRYLSSMTQNLGWDQ